LNENAGKDFSIWVHVKTVFASNAGDPPSLDDTFQEQPLSYVMAGTNLEM